MLVNLLVNSPDFFDKKKIKKNQARQHVAPFKQNNGKLFAEDVIGRPRGSEGFNSRRSTWDTAI